MAMRRLNALGLGAAAIAAASGFYLLRRFDPNAVDSPFPPCMFNALTGLYCPGCGTTRALHALAHFDVPGAMAMNPLLVLFLPLIPLLIAWSIGWQPRWLRPMMRVLAEPKFWLVLLPGYWIARNLPWFPFNLLAPG